jgi:predicted DNA-binding transcriptional regulator YafY
MRRTDRLFDLIQILRDGRLHRASQIAEVLQVSVRTIWRDMATLTNSGLPVEGERGVGYILRAPVTLPPMILGAHELDALRLGIRLVSQGDDPVLARAARELAQKIGGLMPAPVRAEGDDIFDFPAQKQHRPASHLPILRKAIRAHQRLTLTYIDLNGVESHRDIRPLLLDLKSQVWVLVAWCEARGAFRSFRLDRILSVIETGQLFPNERGTRLRDYRHLISDEQSLRQGSTTRAMETQSTGHDGS